MIYINNNSGLGNKIKNLVSCLRLGHKKNISISPFNIPFIKYSQLGNGVGLNQDITTWRLELFEDKEKQNYLKTKSKFIVFDTPDVYYIEDGIDCQYHNICDFIIEDFLNYFNLIYFDDLLLKEVNHLCKTYNIDDKIGVHVRSWSDDYNRFKYLHNLNLFIHEMEKESKNFFLFTDKEEIYLQLKKIFKDKLNSIHIVGERHNSFNNLNTFNALKDLLLLSRCSKIIGTYQSTFTECAWWLGKCKQNVVIPKPEIIKNLELNKKIG